MHWSRVTPPGYGTGLVCAQLGQDKVRSLGAVSIKHVHAVLWRSRLWARPLARGAFSRLAWHLGVVIVGYRADQAEVGDGVVSPHAAAMLRVWTWWTRHSWLLLARHLAVIK